MSGIYADVVDVVIGNSATVLPRIQRAVDIFMHDSMGSAHHEHQIISSNSATIVERHVLTDNAMKTNVLAELAEELGWQFLVFKEVPREHWWPGDAVGAAWRRQSE